MKMKKRIRFFLFPLVMLFVILPLSSTVVAAEATVNLGSTESYAVLAGSTITNTGPTVISGTAGGDIGLHPGTSITGFPPGTVGGTTHTTDAAAEQAKVDLVIAYNDAASRTPTVDLSGQDLGGKILTTGVYFFSSSAGLTGTLTLDAQGDPEAVFIFQIGSALTTASASVVSLTNGARFCRVFWQVTSSATLGTNSEFAGHILAMQSITATTGATVQGQLLARNAAVTLDSNTITNGICAAVATTTPAPTATPTPTTAPGVTAVPTTAPGATAVPTTAPGATAVPTTAPGATAVPTTATGSTPVPTTGTAATTATGSTPVPTTGTTELAKTGENTQKQIMIGGLLLVISGSLVFLLVSRRKNIQK